MASAKQPDQQYDDEAAIDDEEADEEFAELQRTMSSKRRDDKEKVKENRIQEILPFPFSPNIRPLGISDLWSTVALENAAFSDPQHRASPEKVRSSRTSSLTCLKCRLGLSDQKRVSSLSTASPSAPSSAWVSSALSSPTLLETSTLRRFRPRTRSRPTVRTRPRASCLRTSSRPPPAPALSRTATWRSPRAGAHRRASRPTRATARADGPSAFTRWPCRPSCRDAASESSS